MKRPMRGLLHRLERNKANVVRLAHFFQRPANAHVARQPWPPSGELSKAVMVGVVERVMVIFPLLGLVE
jgi:hypothetical protein